MLIFHPGNTKWRKKNYLGWKILKKVLCSLKAAYFGCISWTVNSNCRIRSVGAATAHICWFSPPSQPFITKRTAPTCCRASWNATTSAVTWTQLGNTQKTSIRTTRPSPHWSVCWANTTSFPSLLSPTILTRTTRLANLLQLNFSTEVLFFFCGYYYYYSYYFFLFRNSKSISPLLRLACCKKIHPISCKSWKLPLRWNVI